MSTQYGDVVYFSLVDSRAQEPLVWTATIPTDPAFNFTPVSKVEDHSFALFQIDPYSKDEREVASKRGRAVLPSALLRLLHLQTGCYMSYSGSDVLQQLKLKDNSCAPVGLAVHTRRPGIEDGVCEGDEVAILARKGESQLVLERDGWFKGISSDRFLIHRFESFSNAENSAIRLGQVCKLRSDNGMFLSILPHTDLDFPLVLDAHQMTDNYTDGGELCYPEYQGHLKADLSSNGEDGNAYWVIEGGDRFKGGTLCAGTAFYLRHVASRRYLSADLTLTCTPAPFTLASTLESELTYGQLNSLVTEGNDTVSIDLTPSLSSVKTEVFGAVLSDLDPYTVLRLPLTASGTQAQTQSLKFLVLQVDREQANKALELALYLPRLSEMRLALQHLKKQPNVPKVLYGISNRINLQTLAVDSSKHTFQAQIASDFQIVNEMLRIWILMQLMYSDYQEYFDDVNFFVHLRNPMQNIQFYERVSRNLFSNRKFLLSLASIAPVELTDILQWSLRSHLPKDEDRLFWAQKYFSIIPEMSDYNALTSIFFFCHLLLDRLPTKMHLSNTEFIQTNGHYILRFEHDGTEIYEWTHSEKRSFQEAIEDVIGFTVTCLELLADLCASTDLKDEIEAGTGLDMKTCLALYRASSSNQKVQMAVLYFISKMHVREYWGLPLTQVADARLLRQFTLHRDRTMLSSDFYNTSPLAELLRDEVAFWVTTAHVPLKGEDPTTWYYNAVVHFRFVASLMENCPMADVLIASMASAAVSLTWTALGEEIVGFSERFPKLCASKYRTETEKQRTVEELLELLLVYQKWKLVKVLHCCWVEKTTTKDFVQACADKLQLSSIFTSLCPSPLSSASTALEVDQAAVSPEIVLCSSQVPQYEKVQVRTILEHIVRRTSYTCRGSHQVVLSLLEREYDFAEYVLSHMRGVAAMEPFTEFLPQVEKLKSLALSYQQTGTNTARSLENLENYINALEELVDFMLELQQDEASFAEYQQFLDKADFIKELKRAWSFCAQVPDDWSEIDLFVSLRTLVIEASRLYVYNCEEHKKQLLHILPTEGFYLDYPQFIHLLIETHLMESGGEVAANMTQVIFEMARTGSKKRLLLALRTLLSAPKLPAKAIFTIIKHYKALAKDDLSNCEWEILAFASLSLTPEDRKQCLSEALEKWYHKSKNIRKEGAAIAVFSIDTLNPTFRKAIRNITGHFEQINQRSVDLITSRLQHLGDSPKSLRVRNYEDMDSDMRYLFEMYFDGKNGVLVHLPAWFSMSSAPQLAQQFAVLYLNTAEIPALEKFSRMMKTCLVEYYEKAGNVLDVETRNLLERAKLSPPQETTRPKLAKTVPRLSPMFSVCEEAAGPRALVAAVLRGKAYIGPEVFAELKSVFLLKKAEEVYMEACLEAASRLKPEDFEKKEHTFLPVVEELLELAISHRTEKMQEVALHVLYKVVCKLLNIRPFLIATLQHRQLYIRFFSVFATFIEKRKRLLRIISAETGSTQRALMARLGTVNSVLQRFLQLLQKCCDGCFYPFQTYLRTQSQESRSSVNVVSLATGLLMELLTSPLTTSSEQLIHSCAVALVEMVSGPCRENQEEVCHTFGFVTELADTVDKAAITGLSSDLSVESSLVALALALVEGQERDYESIELMMPMDFSVFGKLSEKLSSNLSAATLKKMDLGLPTSDTEKKQFALATESLIVCFSTMREDQLAVFKNHRLLKYIASVEINQPSHKVPVSTITFRIPFIAQFLTRQTAVRVLSEIDRDSRLVKLEDFTTKVDQCEVEMRHQQRLSRFAVLKAGTQYWRHYLLSSFALIVLLNLMLIGLVHEDADERFAIHESGRSAMRLFGAIQLVLITWGTLSYYLEYWYSLRQPIRRKKTSSTIEDLPYIKNLGGASSRFFAAQVMSTLRFDLHEVAKALVQVAYVGVSLAAIASPHLYPFLLFQILNLNSSVVNILKSVTNRATQLLLALFFALIVIFAHSFYAYFYLYQYYDNENGLFCSNLRECFFSTISTGLRSGGGIGDALGPTAAGDFYIRMAFDLLFYVTITTVLVAIVFGLIIDTFSELRDERTEMEADMNNVCLICGHKRSVIELKGEGWQKHTLQVHNPFSYMYFLLYLKDREVLDCSGIEKMVKECRARKNVNFYPITSAAIGLTDAGNED